VTQGRKDLEIYPMPDSQGRFRVATVSLSFVSLTSMLLSAMAEDTLVSVRLWGSDKKDHHSSC
jgi:hypothetical protein